jgi:hypothetical protein
MYAATNFYQASLKLKANVVFALLQQKAIPAYSREWLLSLH